MSAKFGQKFGMCCGTVFDETNGEFTADLKECADLYIETFEGSKEI